MHCNRSSSVGTCSRAGHARRLLPPNNICAAHPTKATNSRDPDAANDGTAVARAAKYFCKLYSAWSRSREHRKRITNNCAMPTKCNCKLPRNPFEDQASAALPKPCACSGNSASLHVLAIQIQFFSIILFRSLKDVLVDRIPLCRACKTTANAADATAGPSAK